MTVLAAAGVNAAGNILGGLLNRSSSTQASRRQNQMIRNQAKIGRQFTKRESQKARRFTKAGQKRAMRFQVSQDKVARQFQHRQDRRARRYTTSERKAAQRWAKRMDNTKVRRAVRDAKRAGVHPLFALGASGNYSPAFQSASGHGAAGTGVGGVSATPGAAPPSHLPGQPITGSFASDAVQELGGLAAEYLRSRSPSTPTPEEAARIRALDAAAARDEAEAAAARSRVALNTHRIFASPSSTKAKDATLPAVASATKGAVGTPGRPVDVKPNLDMPLWVRAADSHGDDIWAINPEFEQELLNAFLISTQGAKNAATREAKSLWERAKKAWKEW